MKPRYSTEDIRDDCDHNIEALEDIKDGAAEADREAIADDLDDVARSVKATANAIREGEA